MRVALFCSALGFAFLVGGCSSSCPVNTKSCLGVCVATETDPFNCGTCGTTCSTGQACMAGTCVVTCPAGSTACNDLCVNIDTDQDNCGGCGVKCAAGQACADGACGTSCLAGFSVCGVTAGGSDAGGEAGDGGQVLCSDLLTDTDNCGRCGFVCPTGSICNGNGACAESCATGFSSCTPTDKGTPYCANFTTDNENCGSCGAPCASGQACSASHCATSCATGFNACGGVDGGVGTCANLLTDAVNCGGCGRVCLGGTACSDGGCTETCASGFSACNVDAGAAAYCADFLTDSNNCGVCGKSCPAGQSCQGGTCAETCAAGFNACTGDGGALYCADFLTDNANCNGCGKPCPAGEVCNGSGACTESCATGFSACSNGNGPYCANLTNDARNCNACGKLCPAGQTCKSSACAETCSLGYSVCGTGTSAYCANLTADSNNCGTCGTVCPGGQSCSDAGLCVESCAAGYSACTGAVDGGADAGVDAGAPYCANLKNNVSSCGTCGTNCAASFEAPGCCSGTCTGLANGDANNCGTCGTVCTGGVPACCNAGCVDESSDANNCGGCGTVCASGICQGENCCAAACGVDSTTNCNGACAAGTGACTHPSCNTGYGCGTAGTACKTSCSASSDCATNYTCRGSTNGICCAALASGSTLYVDGKTGSDSNCCSSASPCLTITHAMSVISSAAVSGVIVSVAWNATPTTRSDWSPATAETYPIHLGYGVTLEAPGIFFTPKAGAGLDVFDVYSYGGNDTAAVTIEGTSTDYMLIGFDSKQTNLTGAGIAVNSGVAGKTAVPLTLSKVWMNAQTEALYMGPGADVSLGPSAVIIGSGASTSNPLTAVKSPGSGIYCKGTAASHATLTDVSGGSGSVLQIDSQDTGQPAGSLIGELLAYDDCDITLSQSPIIGLPPPCPSPKVDGEGVLVLGGSTLALTGATVQCMYNHGIDMGENPATYTDNPTVKLDKTLIQYTGQTGLKCNDGTLSPVTNSTVYHCRFGVVVDNLNGPLASGIAVSCNVDLSGGGNIVACNTDTEPGAFGMPAGEALGINVWNDSTNNVSMNASNVAWDHNPPGYWTCTDPGGASTAATCTCASGTCNGIKVATPDNSDAVTSANTNPTPIDVSKPKLQTTYTCP